MFCTECGTKLEDGAVFCTNCGYKIPAEAVVTTMAAAETPVATPVAEPVQSASQSMYTEPTQNMGQSMYSQPAQDASQSMYSQPSQDASQSMYSQPAQDASQSMYSQPSQNTSQSMYSQPAQNTYQSMYSQPDNATTGATAGMAYGASQGYGTSAQSGYGAQNPYGTQNTYNAQQANASYNYNAAPQPQKKKGKGCLIAALIGGGILVIVIIVVIIAIIAGISMMGSGDDYDYSYDADYSYSYDYGDEDDSIVPDELDDMMDDADDYDYVPSSGEYDLYDIYGEWEGTSKLVSVSGADEMQEYLEGLIGRPLTEDEIAGLNGTNAEEEWFGFNMFAYDAAGNGVYEDGFWELWLNMGSYFDEEYFDIYDAMTYDQYMDDDYSTAAIDLDSNNCFEIEVMERDYYGEYGCQFFDAYDYDVQEAEVEEDGAYGFVINGQVVDGEDGPEIHGEMVVMFQYGDMEEPYGMAYEYVLTDYYDVY